jgi:hypothetical protein
VPAWGVGRDGKPLAKLQPQEIQAVSSHVTNCIPKTSSDFEREWRRRCSTNDERYMFLRRLSPATIQQLFKLEIKSTILADILSALSDCWLSNAGANQDTAHDITGTCGALSRAASCGDVSGREQLATAAGIDCARGQQNEPPSGEPMHRALQEASTVLQILVALTQCGRFQLIKVLLPKIVKVQTESLMHELLEAAGSSAELEGEGFTQSAVRETALDFGIRLLEEQ